MVAEQLQNVRDEIRKACEKSGRDPKEVTLIAVSKTKPISMIEEAMEAGQTIFGENKVQELCTKYEELPKNLEWHLIGHLQTNKIKYIVDKVAHKRQTLCQTYPHIFRRKRRSPCIPSL